MKLNLPILLFILFKVQPFSAQEPIKIAIIGGGIAGVSAAHHILELTENVHITVFEKKLELGGNARTIEVENNFGNLVSIDAGAQYFKDELWANYIALLKAYNLYNENPIFAFDGSAVIENDLDDKPDFISPNGLKLRGGKFGDAMQFLKFFNAARKVYDGKIEYAPTVGAWVDKLKLKDDFKKKVAIPFLASTLGTTVQQVKICSTKDIVKLFASQKALKKSEFKAFGHGMGLLIQNIGKQLEKNGVVIFRNAEVKHIHLTNEKFILEYNETENLFDFVVFAAHPYQVAKITSNEPEFEEITRVLNEFEYFQASIIFHRDTNFIALDGSSFMNVKTSKESNNVLSSTMNLGVVNPEWKGLFKSWMTEQQLELVKTNGMFIHRETFHHPLITPEFHSHLLSLKNLTNELTNIYFAGGWSEGLETQETATNSGKKAAEKVKVFLEAKMN